MLVFALIADDLLFLLGKPLTTFSAATTTWMRYLLADSGEGHCGPSCCNASAAVIAEQVVVQVLTAVKVIVKVKAQWFGVVYVGQLETNTSRLARVEAVKPMDCQQEALFARGKKWYLAFEEGAILLAYT